MSTKNVLLSNLINDPDKYGSCDCSKENISAIVDDIQDLYAGRKKLKNNTSGYTGVYSIKDKNEAIEYLKNNTLKHRLIEICEALLSLESDDDTYVMGYPDDLKLKSSMTLFSEVSDIDVFKKVLDKFYNGEKDEMTISLLNK